MSDNLRQFRAISDNFRQLWKYYMNIVYHVQPNSDLSTLEMGTESCTDGREMVVKREVASPTSLSGSAAEDEEHSTTHNKAHGVIGPASLKMNSSDVHKTNNLKIKIKLEDKSKCSKCLVSNFYLFL